MLNLIFKNGHYKICNYLFNKYFNYSFNFSVEEKKDKTVKNLLNAKEKVSAEILDLREKIKLAKETINKFKEEISKAQVELPVDVSGVS